MKPTVDGIFTTCTNLDYEATWVVFEKVIEFVLHKGAPIYHGKWLDMPDTLGKREVNKFRVEDNGHTVFVWVEEERK